MIEVCKIMTVMEKVCRIWIFLLSSEQELGAISSIMFYIANSPSNIAYTMSSVLTIGRQADNKQKNVAFQIMQYQTDKVLAKVFCEY